MKISVGLLPLLTVLFVGLKLSNIITWSWWWVLAPLWGPFALVIALGALGLGCIGLFWLISRIVK